MHFTSAAPKIEYFEIHFLRDHFILGFRKFFIKKIIDCDSLDQGNPFECITFAFHIVLERHKQFGLKMIEAHRVMPFAYHI